MAQNDAVRQLHERLGRVGYQPVGVASYTNKRLTVNYRVPVEQLRQLVPEPLRVETIRDTGMGLLSQCVCDFTVHRLGPLPIPPTPANEMLCRISVQVPKHGEWHRAYYTLRSDTSSRLLGTLGGYFSHFRKAISDITKRDSDGVYELTCRAADPIADGHFRADLASLSREAPPTSAFADVAEATDFVFQLAGSCGYSYATNQLSFQKIEYPEWDIQFCHSADYHFNLLNHLFETYGLDAEFDCVLFMEKIAQVWGASWLYPVSRAFTPRQRAARRIALW